MQKIEKASLKDAKKIKRLIDFYAAKEKLIARPLSEIYEHIRDFFVFRDGGKVIGCCALYITWGDLAEIKALAVDPKYVKKGIGSKLVRECINDAGSMGIAKMFTLTMAPEFFRKQGFKPIKKSELPKKIWGECLRCSRYPDCDEDALIFYVKK
jgi:amino-acid N-acetyltransferase